jgi:signal transduction histidine kinase
LDFLVEQLSDKSKTNIVERLHDSKVLVKNTMKLIRNIMANLRPLILDDYGLIAAIHWYSDQFSNRTKIPVVFKGEELEPRLLPDVETNLFRITQEALTNVAKYAHASKVTIALDENEGKVTLNITDDGVGFDPLNTNKSRERRGLGLIGMRERAEAIGGTLNVVSSPDNGTRITVEVKR